MITPDAIAPLTMKREKKEGNISFTFGRKNLAHSNIHGFSKHLIILFIYPKADINLKADITMAESFLQRNNRWLKVND